MIHLTRNISIVFCVIAFSFLNGCIPDKDCAPNLPYFVDHIVALDASFLVTPDSSIVVAQRDRGLFQLHKYEYPYTQASKRLSFSSQDVFSPFLLSKQIGGISDTYGDEHYQSTINDLNEFIGALPLQSIRSSPNGRYVVYQFKDQTEVYLYDAANHEKKMISSLRYRLHGVSFSDNEQELVISYDDKLLAYDLINKEGRYLANALEGEKLNPFIYRDSVYFVNNNLSEFYQVFSSGIDQHKSDSVSYSLVHTENHDLRLPKRTDSSLYYIEIINSQYLLRRIDLISKAVLSVNSTGVVYDYQFVGEKKIAIMYSAFNTPRSIIVYDLEKGDKLNLINSEIDFGASFSLLTHDGLSPAYEFSPNKNTRRKGVVLFFHPGMHSDFSPRWDTDLMSLCHAGYVVVSPNYPMSTGYGKVHFNKNLESATKDMLSWKNKIRDQYPDLPIYCFAYSSGSVLMESFLAQNHTDIAGSASFFGTAKRDYQRNLPAFYIFGKNDPFIENNDLDNSFSEHDHVIILEDEGHWIRRRNNQEVILKELYCFFSCATT